MAPSKKISNTSYSSSALVVAASQADDSRRTTRGMKAKASQDATTSEDHDNTNTSQDATSSAINTSPSTNNSAKKPISKPASKTAQKTKPTTSGLAKGKTAKAQASKPQQNKAPSKAKSKKLATDKVADTSHIIKKTYFNGKILLNSNGKPKNFQVALDAELDKWLTKENTKRNLWGTQIEPVSALNMRSDFEAMGFDADKVDAMMGTRETLKVDGLTQRPAAGTGKRVPNTGPLPVKKTPKPKGKGKYEVLKIWADQRKFSQLSLSLGTHSLTTHQHGSSSTLSKATPPKPASLPSPSPHWTTTRHAMPALSCSTRRKASSPRKPRPPLSGTAASTTQTSVPGSRAGNRSEAAGSSPCPSQSQREQHQHQRQHQRQQSALSSAAVPSATPRAPRRLPRRPSPLPPLLLPAPPPPARSAKPTTSRRQQQQRTLRRRRR
jgi:hypothetical protein